MIDNCCNSSNPHSVVANIVEVDYDYGVQVFLHQGHDLNVECQGRSIPFSILAAGVCPSYCPWKANFWDSNKISREPDTIHRCSLNSNP